MRNTRDIGRPEVLRHFKTIRKTAHLTNNDFVAMHFRQTFLTEIRE